MAVEGSRSGLEEGVRGMWASTTIRHSGLAMLVGAVVVFVTALITALAFVGDPTRYANNALYVPVNVVSFVGFALLLVGLAATFVAWSRVGALGMIGLALI